MVRIHSVDISVISCHADFFVKPISGIFSGPRIAILAHLEALNFDFHDFVFAFFEG